MSVLKRSFTALCLSMGAFVCCAGNETLSSKTEPSNDHSDTTVVNVTASLSDVIQYLIGEAEPYLQLCAIVSQVTFKNKQLLHYRSTLFSVGPNTAPVVSYVDVKDLTPEQMIALASIVKIQFQLKDLKPLEDDPSGIMSICVNVPEPRQKPKPGPGLERSV